MLWLFTCLVQNVRLPQCFLAWLDFTCQWGVMCHPEDVLVPDLFQPGNPCALNAAQNNLASSQDDSMLQKTSEQGDR